MTRYPIDLFSKIKSSGYHGSSRLKLPYFILYSGQATCDFQAKSADWHRTSYRPRLLTRGPCSPLTRTLLYLTYLTEYNSFDFSSSSSSSSKLPTWPEHEGFVQHKQCCIYISLVALTSQTWINLLYFKKERKQRKKKKPLVRLINSLSLGTTFKRQTSPARYTLCTATTRNWHSTVS